MFVPGTSTQVLRLHVVGMVALEGAAAQAAKTEAALGSFGSAGSTPIQAVAPVDSVIAAFAPPAGAARGPSPSAPGTFSMPPLVLNWNYALDLSHVTTNNVADLSNRLTPLQTQIPGVLSDVSGIQGSNVIIQTLNALNTFTLRVILLQIPVILLLVQVFGLVLLFVRLMADILVDRQADAIAVLRSRGAARRQIFGALTVQGLALGLIALVLGPLAAIPIVRFIALHTLSGSSAATASVLGGNPIALALTVKWFAIVAVVVAGGAMIFSINRAASFNVVALRRESARATTKPLWQRLNLDVIAAVIGVALYSIYVFSSAHVTDANVRLALSPLALVVPLFLLVAVGLLFMRFFPAVLRLMAHVATRGHGATAMVATAQMARAPRQALRMTLLFALATAFVIFVLVYGATEQQRVYASTAYQVGADFSGTLAPPRANNASVAALTARFAGLPGVRAASVGYSTTFSDNTVGAQVTLIGVDTQTYGTTALWSADDASQPLPVLMADLLNQRPTAASQDAVAAIVDDAMASIYHLRVGDSFTLSVPGYSNGSTMHLIVLALVQHIPSIYDDARYLRTVGIVVDYPSVAAVSTRDTAGPAPQPNAIWLRTASDAASLASVRAALGRGRTTLAPLLDRRALITQQQTDPLQIDLLGALSIGAALVLLLALLGTWIASWLNARARVTSFAVLRALGTTPGQIVAVLIWEQTVVYLSALVLGMALGWLLAQSVLPTLIFANFASGLTSESATIGIPPLHAVVPLHELALLLGGLVAVCVVATAIMARLVSRSVLGQALRLNED